MTHATVQSIALRSLLRALSCCEAAKDSRAPSCTRFELGQLPITSRAATRSSMVWARPQARQLKQRDVGMLQAEISSFLLHLAAGGKSAKTIRTYTGAVQWFAPDCLLPAGRTAWAQADRHDIRAWMTCCWTATAAPTPATSTAPCSSSSDGWPPKTTCPDPMTGLRPPPVPLQAAGCLPFTWCLVERLRGILRLWRRFTMR